jgi:hypothetical protein
MAMDFLPAGIKGFEVGKASAQQDQAFALDVQTKQQNLYAKSLEIQNFIDNEPLRATQRRVDTKMLESTERQIPLQEETSNVISRAKQEMEKLNLQSAREEEEARPLFGLNADNYKTQYESIPKPFREKLGLTGDWSQDSPRIMQTREAAINNAAHMRAMDMKQLALDAKGTKGAKINQRAISLTQANQKSVNDMLANDPVFNALGDDSRRTYRSMITYLASDLYQRNLALSNADPSIPWKPFTEYYKQVKQIADAHVSGEGGILSGMFNTRDFDTTGFQQDISQQLGMSVPQKAIDALNEGETQNLPSGVDTYEGPQPQIPPDVRAGMEQASDIINRYRSEYGTPNNVPDFVIFNGLVEAGYLNPDGSVASKKRRDSAPPKSRTTRRSARSARGTQLREEERAAEEARLARIRAKKKGNRGGAAQ